MQQNHYHLGGDTYLTSRQQKHGKTRENTMCTPSQPHGLPPPPSCAKPQATGHFIHTNTYYAPTHSQTQTNTHVTTNTIGRLDTHTLPSYNKSIKAKQQGTRGNGDERGLGAEGAMFRGAKQFQGATSWGPKTFAIWRAKKRGDGPAGGGVSGAVAWVF